MARRRYHRRLAGVLGVLVVLQAILVPGQASPEVPALAMHPSLVPTDGTPFLVRVVLHADPSTRLEVKAWVGSARREASRTWNGTAWVRGDRYAVTVETDGNGTWSGWLRLRVNPDGAAYADLLGTGNFSGIWVRVRDAGGTVLGTAHAEAGLLRPADAATREGRTAGFAVGLPEGDGWAALAAVAPDPGAGDALPVPGAFRVEVPRGSPALEALDASGRSMGPVATPAVPQLRLVQAVPRPPTGGSVYEAWTVANGGSEPANLSGTCLRTGGGRACFLAGTLLPGGTATVAANATAYEGATGDAAVPLAALHVEGDPSLPDTAGALTLRSWGHLEDVLAYGDGAPPAVGWTGPRVPSPFPGQVLRRTRTGGTWSDGNSSADWVQAVEARLGQSRLHPTWQRVHGRVWTALAPTDDLALLHDLLASANRSIAVEVYLLTSPVLGRDLVAGARRGLNVTVLVDGNPVGGMPQDERAILENVAAAGGHVFMLRSVPGFGRRYVTLHAKVAVVDGVTSVVGSENWVSTGYPQGGGFGNRGWVVAVSNRSLARTLGAVLRTDRAPRPDVAGVVAPAHPPPLPPVPVVRAGTPARGRVVDVRIQPILAPDTSLDPDTVLGFLGGANRTLDVELLSLDATWHHGPSPLMAGLEAAARRGVHVRVLLDGTYLDPATGAPRNAAAMRALQAVAAHENLSLEARLVPKGTFSKVHVKGAVADGSRLLVGSLNWGETSMTRDREVDLRIQGGNVAAPYEAAFATDWARAGPGGQASLAAGAAPLWTRVQGAPSTVAMGAAALLGVVLVGLGKDRTRRRK